MKSPFLHLSLVLITSVVLGLLTIGSLAFGGTEGHGGGGVLCTDAETGMPTLEIVDFWVGRQHGLDIQTSSNEDMFEILKRGIQKQQLSKGGRKDILNDVKRMIANARPVAAENFMAPHDTGPLLLDPHCRIVGIVNYRDGFLHDKIELNPQMYSLLSNTSKAALWLHEEYYRWRRQYAGQYRDSKFAQRVVAITFSNDTYTTPKWPPIKH